MLFFFEALVPRSPRSAASAMAEHRGPTSAASNVQEAYWRAQLAGAPALLELPTDRARPAEPSGRGAAVDVELPPHILKGLTELAAGCGATLYMTLLAAWQVGT